MGQNLGRLSDPLQMSLDEYILKNRPYIKEAPKRRQLKERRMEHYRDEMKGSDRIRWRGRSPEPLQLKNRGFDRYQLRERSVEPFRLRDRSIEPYLKNRSSLMNGMLARPKRTVSNHNLLGKRVVQERPRQRSIVRYKGMTDINERMLKMLQNRKMIENNADVGAKLFISNLSGDVTNRDIMDLFDEFGEIVSSTVHYSLVGQSLGTADIIFGNKDSAIEAMTEYNGVPLDGKPMNIALMSTAEELGIRTKNQRQGWRGRREEARDRGRGQ